MPGTFARQHARTPLEAGPSSGFSLIEVIIVIALFGIVYSVALPQLGVTSQSEISSRLGKIASDIRAAYDMAVLNRKPHRLVFELASGNYWLEVADREMVTMGDQKMAHDPTEDEIKEQEAQFETEFERYEELAGKEVEDHDNDRVIKPTSPVLAAKDKLKPVKWTAVNTQEWGIRKLAPILIIGSMQAEHHAEKQTLEALGETGRVMLYFFPQGYVERAAMWISKRKAGGGIDESEPPYVLTTNPYEGTADVDAAKEEVDVSVDKDNNGF